MTHGPGHAASRASSGQASRTRAAIGFVSDSPESPELSLSQALGHSRALRDLLSRGLDTEVWTFPFALYAPSPKGLTGARLHLSLVAASTVQGLCRVNKSVEAS